MSGRSPSSRCSCCSPGSSGWSAWPARSTCRESEASSRRWRPRFLPGRPAGCCKRRRVRAQPEGRPRWSSGSWPRWLRGRWRWHRSSDPPTGSPVSPRIDPSGSDTVSRSCSRCPRGCSWRPGGSRSSAAVPSLGGSAGRERRSRSGTWHAGPWGSRWPLSESTSSSERRRANASALPRRSRRHDGGGRALVRVQPRSRPVLLGQQQRRIRIVALGHRAPVVVLSLVAGAAPWAGRHGGACDRRVAIGPRARARE